MQLKRREQRGGGTHGKGCWAHESCLGLRVTSKAQQKSRKALSRDGGSGDVISVDKAGLKAGRDANGLDCCGGGGMEKQQGKGFRFGVGDAGEAGWRMGSRVD